MLEVPPLVHSSGSERTSIRRWASRSCTAAQSRRALHLAAVSVAVGWSRGEGPLDEGCCTEAGSRGNESNAEFQLATLRVLEGLGPSA